MVNFKKPPLSMKTQTISKPEKAVKSFGLKSAKQRARKVGMRSQTFRRTPDELDLSDAVKGNVARERATKLPIAVLFPSNE